MKAFFKTLVLLFLAISCAGFLQAQVPIKNKVTFGNIRAYMTDVDSILSENSARNTITWNKKKSFVVNNADGSVTKYTVVSVSRERLDSGVEYLQYTVKKIGESDSEIYQIFDMKKDGLMCNRIISREPLIGVIYY